MNLPDILGNSYEEDCFDGDVIELQSDNSQDVEEAELREKGAQVLEYEKTLKNTKHR